MSQLGPRVGRFRGVLAPHALAARATVAAHSELQHRRSPAQRNVGQPAHHRASGHALLAALVAPVVAIADQALKDRAIGFDQLAGGSQSQPVELAEGVEIRRSEGSVGHVEVFRMGSVGTSIIGRPRRLPGHRRAASCYTLNCEEPLYLHRHFTVQPRTVHHRSRLGHRGTFRSV